MTRVWIYSAIVLYVLCAAFFSWRWSIRQKSIYQGTCMLVASLALPVVGTVLMLLCEVMRKRSGIQRLETVPLAVSDGMQYEVTAEEEENADSVPMAEALSVSSYKHRRSIVMQLIRAENTLEYLDVLRDALENEDTETSHYASVIIMELQHKVQEKLAETEFLYQQNPDDTENAEQWEQLLYQVLQSSLYDEYNRARLFSKYADVSDRLFSAGTYDRRTLRHRVKIAAMQKNYTQAQQFCTKYLESFPDSEEAVLCQIRLYIDTKNAQGMQSFLRTLPERPVLLTRKTLDYIRIFKKDEVHG